MYVTALRSVWYIFLKAQFNYCSSDRNLPSSDLQPFRSLQRAVQFQRLVSNTRKEERIIATVAALRAQSLVHQRVATVEAMCRRPLCLYCVFLISLKKANHNPMLSPLHQNHVFAFISFPFVCSREPRKCSILNKIRSLNCNHFFSIAAFA